MSGGDKKTKVIGNYKIGKVLGTGSYGYVRLGVNMVTGEQFAIKTLKDPQNKKGIQREISILKLLEHPNIVKLYDVIEDPKTGTYYLVLELAAGGELFDYIVARGKLKEREARKFFRQIISGVEYCHSNLVIHRDLKPENLLLDTDNNIKINDFGFSNIMTPGERFSTFCGSVSYVAPEIIKNIKYIGPEIDIWSLGVILYTLVCGRLPWPETVDGSPAITNIIEGDYDKTPLMTLSASCQNLIAQVLIPDPLKRATLQDIRHHQWVNEGCSGPPPCLVQTFPAVVEINLEILEQITRIGFDETEVRQRILANEQCQEVTMYNLMLHKWKYKDHSYVPKLNGEVHGEADEPIYGRRRGDSMPARPEFKEPIPVEDIKTGSGAGARFAKGHRMSHSFKSATSYGNGEMNNLEALAQALSNGSSADSLSSSSSSGGSPIASASSPINSHTNKRNTMDPQHYRAIANGHDAGTSSRPMIGSTSPPSPMRPRSPNTTHNGSSGHTSPNGSGTAKRRSLIMTGLESAFKSLVRDKDKDKPEKIKEPKVEPMPESRRRSSTMVGLESTFKSIFGSDKVKQVSGVFNVDTTTTQSPQQVMEEIKRVLDIETADVGDFKIEYKVKGHIFKCAYPSRKLKFQLEICRIKNLDLTGVKLKRVKGDLWVYKEYCQRLMSKMRL